MLQKCLEPIEYADENLFYKIHNDIVTHQTQYIGSSRLKF